jgi:hypothetical protein
MEFTSYSPLPSQGRGDLIALVYYYVDIAEITMA